MSSIVIIDDDDLMRELLKEWLVAAGYAVRHARCSGASSGGDVDLVIVDLYMPRRAGGDVVRGIQRAYPGKPIIAISAQFRPGVGGSLQAARALGVERLIAKPCTREGLLKAVHAVIGLAS